jgi:hypothetical protein
VCQLNAKLADLELGVSEGHRKRSSEASARKAKRKKESSSSAGGGRFAALTSMMQFSLSNSVDSDLEDGLADADKFGGLAANEFLANWAAPEVS